jgi:hypothetical protein
MAGDPERADDLVDDDENLTQETMGEGEKRPTDVSWEEGSFGESEASPHEGEEGTEPVA